MDFTPTLAAEFIKLSGPNMQNPELVQLCERFVKDGLNRLLLGENGVEETFLVFKGLISSKHAKSDLKEAMITKISKNVQQLSTSQKCEFVYLCN